MPDSNGSFQSDTPEPQSIDVGEPPVARPIVAPIVSTAQGRYDDLLLLSLPRKSAVVDILVAMLLVFGLESLIGLFVGFFCDVPDGSSSPEAFAQFTKSILFPLLAVRAIGVIGILAALLNWRGQTWRATGISLAPAIRNIVAGVGSAGIAYAIIIPVNIALSILDPPFYEQMSENAENLMNMIPNVSIGAFALVAIVIGIYEELFFRGFIMARLRKATGSWTLAVILSTALFTALHAADQTPAALISITILSLVFSAVTILRRSIVPAMIGHAVFDLSQFIGLQSVAGDAWK